MTNAKAFDRLHPALQRWIYDEGWQSLRDVQEQAIPPILAADKDVVISAATASGKTEAAFLPICSRLASEDRTDGVDVLYVSPLKALINDQTGRLEQLCERVDVPVYRWHGDVSSSAKRKVLTAKGGVLLITPESLEAIFVRRGSEASSIFGGLQYIVIDELHAFLDNERGRQLQSLLHRVELSAQARLPRIGLSATLADLSFAATFLRPEAPEGLATLRAQNDGQDLQLSLLGFLGSRETQHEASDAAVSTTVAIAQHIFERTVGTHALVFANARQRIEELADLLAEIAKDRRIPNQFFPHHGSLAKDLREDVENRLRSPSTPTTAVATSTLELGIDIGAMESVSQVGAPPSVSSLRQRLGRAGRRGEPAVLRIYVAESEVNDKAHPADRLRVHLVESIAMVQLLLQRWYEPPSNHQLDFSTLVQQVLSVIAERNGVTPGQAHEILCGPGPFSGVSPRLFADLLRDMGQAELIMQTSDYTLLLAPVGERIVANFEFFTSFVVAREFRLVANGKTLGTLPITFPVFPGALMVFSGRRWRVNTVDDTNNVIDLAPASAGIAPKFGGETPPLHARVHEQMRRIYFDTDVPPYLSTTARELLRQGRKAYAGFDLAYTNLVQWGNEALLFHWAGDRAGQTLAIALNHHDLNGSNEGIAIEFPRTSIEDVDYALRSLRDNGMPDPETLAHSVANKRSAKYDWVLSEGLADLGYTSSTLDFLGAQRFLNTYTD